MPVPPRPIPRPHPNAQRPGQGVPRKLQTSSFDPRAELDLIAHLPRSLPNPQPSHSALRIIGADAAAAAAASAKEKEGKAVVKGSREMDLGELVREGKGRVKQSKFPTSESLPPATADEKRPLPPALDSTLFPTPPSSLCPMSLPSPDLHLHPRTHDSVLSPAADSALRPARPAWSLMLLETKTI